MPRNQVDDHSHEQHSPATLAALDTGEILCDRRRTDCFEVLAIDDVGIALRQADHEFYVPRSLFVAWYGSRLFPLDETASIDPPEWL